MPYVPTLRGGEALLRTRVTKYNKQRNIQRNSTGGARRVGSTLNESPKIGVAAGYHTAKWLFNSLLAVYENMDIKYVSVDLFEPKTCFPMVPRQGFAPGLRFDWGIWRTVSLFGAEQASSQGLAVKPTNTGPDGN